MSRSSGAEAERGVGGRVMERAANLECPFPGIGRDVMRRRAELNFFDIVGTYHRRSSIKPCSSPQLYFSPFHLTMRSVSLPRSEAVSPGGRSWKNAVADAISGRLWQDTQSNRTFSLTGSLRLRLAAASRIVSTRPGKLKMSSS